MIKRMLLGCALALVSQNAFADVVIRNGSHYEITEVYVAPQSIKSWGDNKLGDKKLEKNDTLTLTGVAPGTWDFQLVFREPGGKEDWKCVIAGIELDEKGDVSTFTDKTLDKCWENTEGEAAEDDGGEEK